MFRHRCDIEDQRIIAQRVNPLDPSWSEWSLVICVKCNELREWQHHSEEQMHGGDLYIDALPTRDYLHHIYKLTEADVDLILAGKKKALCYNRRTKQVEEHDA
ncbi:hypothetical protein QAA18_12560 [Luteimonas sp. 8-5]|uniref:hypothetical protein n=1 Tax=Luteimonas sp. 8-5 TaxID=3039387 RepID=UPI002436C056|nr:hypothetical protein [Luteimonas sp. 8-5]MDG6349556.1 hypothetical protein [Luteimonas sp. 8-5]